MHTHFSELENLLLSNEDPTNLYLLTDWASVYDFMTPYGRNTTERLGIAQYQLSQASRFGFDFCSLANLKDTALHECLMSSICHLLIFSVKMDIDLSMEFFKRHQVESLIHIDTDSTWFFDNNNSCFKYVFNTFGILHQQTNYFNNSVKFFRRHRRFSIDSVTDCLGELIAIINNFVPKRKRLDGIRNAIVSMS